MTRIKRKEIQRNCCLGGGGIEETFHKPNMGARTASKLPSVQKIDKKKPKGGLDACGAGARAAVAHIVEQRLELSATLLLGAPDAEKVARGGEEVRTRAGLVRQPGELGGRVRVVKGALYLELALALVELDDLHFVGVVLAERTDGEAEGLVGPVRPVGRVDEPRRAIRANLLFHAALAALVHAVRKGVRRRVACPPSAWLAGLQRGSTLNPEQRMPEHTHRIPSATLRLKDSYNKIMISCCSPSRELCTGTVALWCCRDRIKGRVWLVKELCISSAKARRS